MSSDTERKSEEKSGSISCGDVIYPSAELSNRILKFSDEEHKGSLDQILLSTNSDISVHLTFINDTDCTLYIYWITHDGDIRVPGSKLRVNKEHRVNSYLSHPFILSPSETMDDLKDIIGIYIPRNRSHSLHRITIRKESKSNDNDNGTETEDDENRFIIESEPGKPDKSKKWTRDSYEKSVICGFTLYFERGIISKFGALLHVLTADLSKINECVPSAALCILHSTPIWLNDDYLYYQYPVADKEGNPYIKDIHRPPESMCFHPSGDWLAKHGNMSHKAECIEVYRVRDFIKERGIMPMVC